MRRPTARRATRWVLGLFLSMAVAAGCGHPASVSHRADPSPTSTSAGVDPLAGQAIYDPPDSVAATTGVRSATTAAERTAARQLAATPTATWMTGTVTGPALTARVAALVRAGAAAHAVPVLVAYDIPHRDCGHFSAGGAATAADYGQFVHAFAAGLVDPAIVIVEPDAVSHLDECGLSAADRTERVALLREAVTTFAAQHAIVYLEAGSTGWHTAATIAARLRAAGLGSARGFALNVSDFKATADVVAFGHEIEALTGAPFVVDTSRNGAGPWQAPAAALPWCNPPGRKVGVAPTTHTGVPGVDAYLWIKEPGVSDGSCGRGDPPAGTWFPAYAAELVAPRG
jgi:endoglucanase